MGRPRAVSAADLNRAFDTLQKAGIAVAEVVVEPGRVRIIPGGLAERQDPDETVKPKEWPAG